MVSLGKKEISGASSSTVASNEDNDSTITKFPDTITSPQPTGYASEDSGESDGELTPVQRSEKKHHDQKASFFRVAKVVVGVLGALIVVVIAIWGYSVGSVAEPIGFIKSELANLKEIVQKIDITVDSHERDLIRIKTILDLREQAPSPSVPPVQGQQN